MQCLKTLIMLMTMLTGGVLCTLSPQTIVVSDRQTILHMQSLLGFPGAFLSPRVRGMFTVIARECWRKL